MEKEFLHQELEIAQAGADVKEGSRATRIATVLTTSFFSLSILLTIGAIAFTIIFFISEVVGPSMMITLNRSYATNPNAHDNVLVNKYVEPKRGDIVVLRHYWDEEYTSPKFDEITNERVYDELFIKRLIAIGGDTIRFEPDPNNPNLYITWVNGEPLNEPYLDEFHWGKMAYYGANIYNYINNGTRPYETHNDYVPFREKSVFFNESLMKYEIRLAPDEIWVMGDNRGSDKWNDFLRCSYDSTSFGPVLAKNIQGVRVDTIEYNVTVPQYIWKKVKYFFSFRWL